MDTPFSRSYWVLPGALLAGYYPGALEPGICEKKLAALLSAGIRVVINLMEPDETDWEGHPFTPYVPLLEELARQRSVAVQCLRFPIRDGGVPEPLLMQQILDALEAALGEGKPTYVHCWGGKGRTGTVVGCFLARRGLAAGEAVLEKITELRRSDARGHEPSPETAAQCEMVRGWQPGY